MVDNHYYYPAEVDIDFDYYNHIDFHNYFIQVEFVFEVGVDIHYFEHWAYYEEQ